MDIFLTYVTNARAASAETPGLDTIALPPQLAVRAEYGLVVVSDLPEAALLVAHLLSPATGGILERMASWLLTRMQNRRGDRPVHPVAGNGSPREPHKGRCVPLTSDRFTVMAIL